LLRREIEFYRSEDGWQWMRNFVIYDETDSTRVLKDQISKLNLDDKVFAAKDMKYTISGLKNDGYSATRYAKGIKTYRETRISEIFSAYQAELARNNALDFDDLILIFNDLLSSNTQVRTRQHQRFRHILVDEFQDTNKAQYDLIRMLASNQTNFENVGNELQERSLMVVGDVDQSIYSWRKADFRIILGFQNDFKDSKLIKLEDNYRSTNIILDVANSVISNNSERIEKVLRCNRSQGSKVKCYEATDEIDEAYYVVEELKRLKARSVASSECVILYRTNAQSRAIEEVLVRHHLPYSVVGGTRFYDRQEIKDILAYLKLIYNERDGQAFQRVVNLPRRGLGKTTLERLASYAEETGISLLEASLQAKQITDLSSKSAISLMEFASAVRRWQMLSNAVPISNLLEMVLKESHYLEKLEEEARSSKDELVLGRVENIRELVAVAKEFEATADEPDLDSFLTRISLVSDLDGLEMEQDAVKLMTLHSAKGLEFPVVFLMGLEEGLFPHIRSLDSPHALEEERRLMYVGITRAADLLYITFARRRMLLGRATSTSGAFSTAYTIPSRFLKEITPGLLTGYYARPEIANEHQQGETEESVRSLSRNTQNVRFNEKRTFRSESSSYSQSNNAIRMSGTAAGAQQNSKRINSEESFEHLKIGDLVQHSKFGIGQVTQIIGEKDKELYNVDFKSAGKRLLDPRFAKLIKI